MAVSGRTAYGKPKLGRAFSYFMIRRRKRLEAGDTTPVPTLVLYGNAIIESAQQGATIGDLSVENGTGSYTYTITADPDGKFAIVGSQLRKNAGLDYETKTLHAVTIQAAGEGGPFTRTFAIRVLNDPADDTLLSPPVNTVLPVITVLPPSPPVNLALPVITVSTTQDAA